MKALMLPLVFFRERAAAVFISVEYFSDLTVEQEEVFIAGATEPKAPPMNLQRLV